MSMVLVINVLVTTLNRALCKGQPMNRPIHVGVFLVVVSFEISETVPVTSLLQNRVTEEPTGSGFELRVR